MWLKFNFSKRKIERNLKNLLNDNEVENGYTKRKKEKKTRNASWNQQKKKTFIRIFLVLEEGTSMRILFL
jgi:hypothetical protein